MKRFLFVLWEGGGNVPPQLGIARRLVQRGHQVRVLGDRRLATDARQAGAEFAPYRRAPHHDLRNRQDDTLRDWEPKTPLARLKRVGDRVIFGPAELYARDVLDEIDDFRPHAIAVDCLLFGGVAGAEKSGLPSALLMHTIAQMPLAGIPPFGLGLMPARGPVGRLRDRLMWRFLQRTFDRIGLDRVNAARAAIGLPPVDHIIDMYRRLSRTLILTSPAFDFAAGPLPSGMRYVGAGLDDPAWAEPWRSPFAAADAGKPLVLVGLGSTFQNQGPLTQRTIDALAELPVRGLVTLGNVFAPEEFRAPANVHVVASAPHASILPDARAVVAHGGHGTVIKALAFGVPLVCVPLGRDQKDNAARVVYAKAGVTLSTDASVKAIRRAIAHVIENPRFAEGARRMANALREERLSDPAVEELEALAAAIDTPTASAVAGSRRPA